MKLLAVKLVICVSFAMFVGATATAYFTLQHMSMFELVLCSTNSGGIRIPGLACEFFLKHYRSDPEYMVELAAGGIDPILNIESDKTYALADFLIGKGLDVNHASTVTYDSPKDSTPLHTSVLFNDARRARFLIEHGANRDARSSYHNNMTPLELASTYQNQHPEKDMRAILQVLAQ